MSRKQLSHELPPHLAERVRPLNAASSRAGEFVLYWMHHAMRVDENPALDVALHVAHELALPVLVYQGLGGSHPYNADRHHFFTLQGARDLAEVFARRDIRYLFHLPRRPSAPAPLGELVRAAAAVVVEEMPVPPFPAWHARLAASAAVPVWAIDTRCLVPMQHVATAHDRAFRFRDAVAAEYARRLTAPWPDSVPASRGLARSAITGVPELASRDDGDLLALIAGCDIDHGVWPVFDTPGGTAAASARWQGFRHHGLATYDRLRNDAAVEPPQGVSRLSPYLHYGQISPFRVAREAAADGGDGARKFLDELLVWRELAHNFCFHRRQLETLDALPGWAQQTLVEHAGDPRQATYSMETLARGRTGSPLWDLCQHWLLRHGELHNNLRMTWAKAIPYWTPDPATALAALLDLNHRFALDGSDPNSYGGLLWALGQFDRPFEPEQAVLGRVRTRSLAAHAKRLDTENLRRRVLRPVGGCRLRIGVIGAGIAGLAAARTLADAGHEVHVFEKARGPGGRTATRRRENGHFDHGAQYFTVRHPDFLRHVRSWEADGIAAAWEARLVHLDAEGRASDVAPSERRVGVPGMNALARHLAEDLTVHYGSRIDAIARADDGWLLQAREHQEFVDAVIVSAPAPQAVRLIAGTASALIHRAKLVAFAPCWAVMATATQPTGPGFDAAFIDDPVLAWAAAGHSKPGRDSRQTWTLHATRHWSETNLETEPNAVARELTARLRALGGPELAADSAVAHRWRYARSLNPLDDGCLMDPARLLALCGDWCAGESRVESAWLSGIAAAGRLIAAAAVPKQRHA